MLRILEDKGHLRHEQDGPRYIFLPTVPREEARETALRKLVQALPEPFRVQAESAASALVVDPQGWGSDQVEQRPPPRFLDGLQVAMRKVLSGRFRGERRSRRKGRSVEFADHRPYVAGDDLRFVDWNIYGRLDQLFLKLFLFFHFNSRRNHVRNHQFTI